MITRANTILMIRITAFRIGPSFDNGHGTDHCCCSDGGGCMMRFDRMFYVVFISVIGFVKRIIEFELFAAKNATFTF